MNISKCTLIAAFFVITVLLSVPIFLWYSFPGLIDKDTFSYLGGYIGSIIGAMASLVGIAITIMFTSKQAQEYRRIQFAPLEKIRLVETMGGLKKEDLFGDIQYRVEKANRPLR